MRGLESHLSYRIALRTFSAAESRAVLGVPDAHRLPPRPARRSSRRAATSSSGSGRRYVSGPAAPRRAPPDGPRPRAALLPRAGSGTARPVPRRSPSRPPADRPRTALPADERRGRGAHRPGHRDRRDGRAGPARAPGLAAAAGPAAAAGRGARPGPAGAGARAGGAGRRRRCGCPSGWSTGPTSSGATRSSSTSPARSGHLAVVGGPRAGKSTALATVGARARADQHPGRAGRARARLRRRRAGRRWPGCRTSARSPTASRPTWCGAPSPSSAPRWPVGSGCSARPGSPRSRSSGPAGRPATSPTSRPPTCCSSSTATSRCAASSTTSRPGCCPLAAQGLSYGLHLAVSANRWSELRPALKDLLGERIELRLGEPPESEVDRRLAAAVPARPGHGLAADGAAAGARRAADRATPGSTTSALVAAIAAAWPGPAVRAGPAAARSASTSTELPAAAPGGPGIPIGVDETARRGSSSTSPPSRTCSASPTPRAARPRCCGSLAQGIGAGCTPDQARIVVVDPRRTLLGAVPGHAPDRPRQHRRRPPRTPPAEIAASLRRRLPGPDGHRRGRCVSAAGGPGPSCTCWSTTTTWSRRPAAAAHPLLPLRGVPAAGQGRRAARGRRPALRWGRPGAVRPAARPAPRARRRRPW